MCKPGKTYFTEYGGSSLWGWVYGLRRAQTFKTANPATMSTPAQSRKPKTELPAAAAVSLVSGTLLVPGSLLAATVVAVGTWAAWVCAAGYGGTVVFVGGGSAVGSGGVKVIVGVQVGVGTTPSACGAAKTPGTSHTTVVRMSKRTRNFRLLMSNFIISPKKLAPSQNFVMHATDHSMLEVRKTCFRPYKITKSLFYFTTLPLRDRTINHIKFRTITAL